LFSTAKLRDIEKLLADSGSAQAVISQGDEVLLDWSHNAEPVDVYAVQKSILLLLIGIAEDKYLLETLDNINHHLEPEWTQLSPWDEAKLSIETLLSMTTGMADDLTLSGEINQTWRYNNVAYNYLKQILMLHTEMSLQALSEAWLFNPLGMTQSHWYDRAEVLPNGTPVTGLRSTAKDLSAIGKLILTRGRWQEESLLQDFFFDQALQSAPAENPAWCWGLWRNDAEFYLRAMAETKGPVTGSIVPAAPQDLIAARGAYGNYIHVVPSLELVITRTTTPELATGKGFEQALWSILQGTS
jgi:CubicO group peptidase (beta-lactamase class C family)